MFPPTFLTSNHPKLPSCVLPVASLGTHSMFDASPSNVSLNFVSDLEFWITVWLEYVCAAQLLFSLTVCLSIFGFSSSNQHQTSIVFNIYKEGGAFLDSFLCYYVDVRWDAVILVCVCVCVYVPTDRLWVLVTVMTNLLCNKFVIEYSHLIPGLYLTLYCSIV